MSPPAAGAATRARRAEAAPLRLPPAPRRVSGPGRHPRAAPARPAAASNLALRLIDHPWLERLVRGRAWIAIVATALLGIVAMQVALLRLGAQIGNETSALNALTQRNETTVAQIGEAEASHGRNTAAASLDMVYPAPGDVTYLALNPGDAARAARVMTVPSGAAIAAADAQRPANAAVSSSSTAATTATTPATTTPATTANPATAPATTTVPTAATTPATTTSGTPTTSGALAGSGTATAPAPTTAAATQTATTTATTPADTTTTAPSTTTPGTSSPPAGAATTAPATTTAGGTTPGQ
jgi:hypothetical protein